jgi:hypothetical protein
MTPEEEENRFDLVFSLGRIPEYWLNLFGFNQKYWAPGHTLGLLPLIGKHMDDFQGIYNQVANLT